MRYVVTVTDLVVQKRTSNSCQTHIHVHNYSSALCCCLFLTFGLCWLFVTENQRIKFWNGKCRSQADREMHHATENFMFGKLRRLIRKHRLSFPETHPPFPFLSVSLTFLLFFKYAARRAPYAHQKLRIWNIYKWINYPDNRSSSP